MQCVSVFFTLQTTTPSILRSTQTHICMRQPVNMPSSPVVAVTAPNLEMNGKKRSSKKQIVSV